ncbi:response regulator transcription factor [Dactylosporangium sp. NPDC005572]|uniref:response regulator transcription factor n=1 Tax=Dactylosporangium sp. NPDC005572 TaxID=3156889 RepID=UPI0033B2DD5A
MSGSPVRVLLVDDHTLLLEAVSELLRMEDDIEIVGTAGDGGSAVAMAACVLPDIVLLDIEMPGETPQETLARIKEVSPASSVIALSMHDGAGLVREMLSAGARGYLHKSVSRQDLVAAIRSVHRDRSRMVVSVSSNGFHAPDPADTTGPGALSAREHEVLALAAQALSNRQIAKQMSITEGTVKRHLRNIFAKLGAVSRIDAVNKAMALGGQPGFPGRRSA